MSASSAPDAGGPARLVAVLAGGTSSRMGEPKATLDLCGRPLISYPLEAGRAAKLEPFVVAKQGSPLPQLECRLVIEPDEPRHPLTGVVAALEHADAPIVALPCDAPLVPPELIVALAGCATSFAMPVHPRPQPMIARYSPSLLPVLRAARDTARSLTSVAVELGGRRLGAEELRALGDPHRMFANANTPGDLERIEGLL